MTHEALVGLAAGVHSALLIGVLAAYHKYGDRTEVTAKSLTGTEQTLRELRRLLASELADVLKKTLERQASDVTVVDPATESYVERLADIFSGEQYRNVVRNFIEKRSGAIVDCRSLALDRELWAGRASKLSWGLLAFVIYEAVGAGALLLDKLGVYALPDGLVTWTFAPTALLFGFCVVVVVGLLLAHDRITDIRMKYAEF